VVCAVGIAGPSVRLTAERVRRDIQLVHEAALAIGRALGFTSPPVVASEVRIRPADDDGGRSGSPVASRNHNVRTAVNSPDRGRKKR